MKLWFYFFVLSVGVSILRGGWFWDARYDWDTRLELEHLITSFISSAFWASSSVATVKILRLRSSILVANVCVAMSVIWALIIHYLIQVQFGWGRGDALQGGRTNPERMVFGIISYVYPQSYQLLIVFLITVLIGLLADRYLLQENRE